MKDKILAMLKEQQPDFDFEENIDFIAEGYLDSYDIITLIADLEAEFSIIISALDILPENFASINALEILINKSSKRD